jgi:hypothetical protein
MGWMSRAKSIVVAGKGAGVDLVGREPASAPGSGEEEPRWTDNGLDHKITTTQGPEFKLSLIAEPGCVER